MRQGRLRLLSLGLLLALIWVPALAGSLIAELDRGRVAANETLTLHLTADGDLAGEPDLRPLEQDFEILGQSSGSSIRVVNGAMSRTRSWTLALAPRRTGRLTIPALALGGARSSPVPVEVTEPAPAAAGGAAKPLFLDARVETESPYVQQGFVYRVRVLYREQPRRASLSEPVADGATVEQAGEDQSYTETVDGQPYTVIERRYRVVPQRSGPLTIRAPRLDALLPEHRPGARRSPFADFDDVFGGPVFQGLPNLADLGGGRRVVERGPDLAVQVRPQPDGTGSDWLPAESVALTDEWTPSPPRFRVGEPVTRTLVITAQGTTGAQLPTLDPGAPDGLKVYPEPPKIEDLPGSGSPAALKTLKLALVPTRAGSLTLPEIRLPWWDTVADRARVAAIPQRTVQVEPAADGATATPAPQVQGQDRNEGRDQDRGESGALAPSQGAGGLGTAPEEGRAADAPTRDRGGPASAPSLPLPEGAARSGAGDLWPWVALLLGLGWLATLIWVWLRRSRDRPGPPAGRGAGGADAGWPGAHRQAESLRTARGAIRHACLVGDPRAARTALLAWGRARWRGAAPRGLGELAARLDAPAASRLLAEIDRANYAAQVGTWDGPGAWEGLAPLLIDAERTRVQPAEGPLPELYPRLAQPARGP